MKKVIKIIVPILLAIAVIFSVCWYLFVYDRDFTQDFLLHRARVADSRGNYAIASWFYDIAYRHSHEDENVAIELAEQFKAIGNYTKAEYTLSNAISDGGSAQLYMALCKTYIEQDKLMDAVTMLDNIADPAIKAELNAIRPKAPVASPQDGYYNEYITVSIQSDDGTVYLSTNGEYPSIKAEPFSGSLKLEGGETTIYALTIGENGLISPLGIMGYTVAGVIEEVTISDPGLDGILRQKLGVSEDHALYSNQLWGITALDISSDAVNLSDFSRLPFLESLNISQGSYENLSALSALTHLKALNIDGVTLTGDELKVIAALPSLTSLTLTRCNLSSVAELSAATGLAQLDLTGNTIRDLEPLGKLPELTVLKLGHNAVTQLTALTGSVKLQELDLSNNSVSSTVALSGCKSLETLRLDNNALANLEGLDKLPGLKLLSVAHNKLTDLSHLENAPELTELDISNNALTEITALGTCAKLTTLKFPENQVTELPSFGKDSPLASIDGTGNQLTALDALRGLKQLNYVKMDNNSGIRSLSPLTSCSALVEVSVYGTAVTDASPLTKMNVIVKYAPVAAN